jgi:spore germination protein KC
MKPVKLLITAAALVLVTTGCWDRFEINDNAFWIGSSLDLSKDGSIQTGAQIAIPARFNNQNGGGVSSDRGTIILTSTGLTLVDSIQGLQDKLPRKIFIGHRRAIFIGEKLARNGIKDIMDQFSRNPDTRLRTDIFVVKGSEGKEALEINSPFNRFSAVAAVDQDRFCRIGDVALRDFFLDAGRDGIRPIMPIIEIGGGHALEKGKIFTIHSAALFDKEKRMVGFLGQRDSLDLFWIKSILKDRYITETSASGTYSIYESNLKSTIKTRLDQDRIMFDIRLSGNGRVLENRSSLNLSDSSSLNKVEEELNRKLKENVEKMIKTVQETYGQDVFGLGEQLHREHPYRWNTVKQNWDQLFPNVTVNVLVDLNIESVGNVGKSLTF